jgi:phosphatidylglycerol:prolipoprotein diacylglycerol transferase
MVVEGMRTDSLFIGNTGIRVSQALSFAIVLVCGVILLVNSIRYTMNPKPIEGVDYYPPMTEKEWAAHERKLARRKRAKDKRKALWNKITGK